MASCSPLDLLSPPSSGTSMLPSPVEAVSGSHRIFPDDAHPTSDSSSSRPTSPSVALPELQPAHVIIMIEQILEGVFDSLNDGHKLRIPFTHRLAQPKAVQKQPPLWLTPELGQNAQHRSFVSFPGTSPNEGRLFGEVLIVLPSIFVMFSHWQAFHNTHIDCFPSPVQVLSILQLAHQALLSGSVVTKRNIFYQNRDLFKDQAVVDRLVDDIAHTLGIQRDSLNIVAASVGIVCGKVNIVLQDGTCSSLSDWEDAMAIPNLRNISKVDLSGCRWVLVIEKEATFRTLAASCYWNRSIAGPGVLVTSKGYPTLVTRLFLNHINTSRPRLPIFGLVDYDPHGIRILRTYKYGSASLSHEQNANVPGMRWLGIKSDDLMTWRSTPYATNPVTYSECETEPLTDADRKTAVQLLHEIHRGQDGQDASARKQFREVQVMLMLSVKAEIQAADDHGDLAGWLDSKLCGEMDAA